MNQEKESGHEGDRIEESRIVSDANLIKDGARIEEGKPQPTDKQVADIRQKLEKDLANLPSGVDKLIRQTTEEIKKTTLSHEQQMTLFAKVKEGDERARIKLIEANRPLVYWAVNRIGNSIDTKGGLETEDLVSYGFIGLIKAVDRFDLSLGNSFSRYGTAYIFGYILNGVRQEDRIIRLPAYLQDQLKRLDKIEKTFKQESGERPDFNQVLQRATEVDKRILNFVDRIMEGDVGERERSILRIDKGRSARNVVSLEGKVRVRDKETPQGRWESRKDQIVDTGSSSSENYIKISILRQMLDDLFSQLNPRQREVLKLRFGLEDGVERTLEEIGQEFNVTRERIRQIEARALKKLRRPSHLRLLMDYSY